MMQEIFSVLIVLSALVFSTITDHRSALFQNDSIEKDVNYKADHPPIVFHENQYFVELDSFIVEDTLLAMLADMNSIEIWEDDDLNLGVWEVIEFPFTNTAGNVILDINDAVAAARRKTRIRSSTLNVQQTIVNSYSSMNIEGSCFDITEYFSDQGDESIKISILDTGISDLTDNSTVELNYNLTEYTGFDYVNNDPIPDDEHGHGSHLTGLIHSITHQSNPEDSRITFDIRKTHDSLGQAYMSSVVFALVDAMKANADVINMSFSVSDVYHDSLFFPLQNVIDDASSEGILIIAAAGNDTLNNDNLSNTALPASFPADNIIAVTSAGCTNTLSAYSNYGPGNVDLATLGENIPGPDLSDGITFLSGTSQAAAIITSVAALKATKQLVFDYQPIKCALIKTSIHYTDLSDMVLSDGIMDFDATMAITALDCQNIMDECEDDLTGENALTGIQMHNVMHETNLNIESDQQINSSSHVTYDASVSATLISGFEVSNGVSFQITTNGCQQ